MDEASRNASVLLEALHDFQCELWDVCGHYRRRGNEALRPYVVIGGRPFRIHEPDRVREFRGCLALGLRVIGADGKQYELGLDVLWDDDGWTVVTDVGVEAETGGTTFLREIPERHARRLDECIEQVHLAIRELPTFEDLVPKP